MTSTTSVYHGYNIPGIVSYLRYFISPSQKPPTIYYQTESLVKKNTTTSTQTSLATKRMYHKTENLRSRYSWLQKRLDPWNQMTLPGCCRCFHFSALAVGCNQTVNLGIGREMSYWRLRAYILPMVGQRQRSPLFSCLCSLPSLFPLPFPMTEGFSMGLLCSIRHSQVRYSEGHSPIFTIDGRGLEDFQAPQELSGESQGMSILEIPTLSLFSVEKIKT